MSHVAELKIELTDLEAVKAACKEMGLTFVENQKTYEWWGRHVGDYPLPTGFKAEDLGKCEHAIQIPGTQWEVGVVRARNKDGTEKKGYTLLCDYYGSRGAPIARALGGKFSDAEQTWCTEMTFGKFTQLYGVNKAQLEAKKKGWLTTRTVKPDGTIKLCMTGM